jgi:hypothetical protein
MKSKTRSRRLEGCGIDLDQGRGAAARHHVFMDDREARAQNLRRRIDLYRRYLREGLDSDRAAYYLAEILSAEKELEKIARGQQS